MENSLLSCCTQKQNEQLTILFAVLFSTLIYLLCHWTALHLSIQLPYETLSIQKLLVENIKESTLNNTQRDKATREHNNNHFRLVIILDITSQQQIVWCRQPEINAAMCSNSNLYIFTTCQSVSDYSCGFKPDVMDPKAKPWTLAILDLVSKPVEAQCLLIRKFSAN